MKTYHLIGVLALVALISPMVGSTAPTVACFDWDCDPSTGTCSFDAGCSSASPYIWKFIFDWGDGSTTNLTGSEYQTHTFSGVSCWSNVTLTVIPWSDDIQSVTCDVIWKTCPFSPILPNSGRCQ